MYKWLIYFLCIRNLQSESQKKEHKEPITWLINRIAVSQVLASKEEAGVRCHEKVKISKGLLDSIPNYLYIKELTQKLLNLFHTPMQENEKLRKFSKDLLSYFNPYDLLKQADYQQALNGLVDVCQILNINLKDAFEWQIDETYSKEVQEIKMELAKFVNTPTIWNSLVKNLRQPNVGDNKRLLSLRLLYDTSLILKLPMSKLKEALILAQKFSESSAFFRGVISEMIRTEKKEEKKTTINSHKKKQEEIMKQFLAKQKMFAIKHVKEIKKIPEGSKEEVCAICRESMNDKKSYGVFALISSTTTNKLMQDCTWKKFSTKFNYSDPKKHLAFTNCNMGFSSYACINTCNHFIHERCYKSFPQKNRNSNCPVCKSKFNCFILTNDYSTKLENLSYYYLKHLVKQFETSILYDSRIKPLEENFACLLLKLFSTSLMASDILGLGNVLSKKRLVLRHLILIFCKSKDIDTICSKFIASQLNNLMFVPFITLFYLIKCRYWNLKDRTKANKEIITLLTVYLRQIKLRYAYAIEEREPTNNLLKGHKNSIKNDFECALKYIAFTLSLCTKEGWKLINEKASNGQALLKFFDIDIPPFESFFEENGLKASFNVLGQTVNVDKIFNRNPISMSFLLEPRIHTWGFKVKESLDLLVETYAVIKCDNCKKNCDRKGVCMICGTILCIDSDCCPDEFLLHTIVCGEGNCMVLLIHYGNVIIATNGEQWREINGLYTNDCGESSTLYMHNNVNKYTYQYEYAKFHLNKQTLHTLQDILINSKEMFVLNQYNEPFSDD